MPKLTSRPVMTFAARVFASVILLAIVTASAEAQTSALMIRENNESEIEFRGRLVRAWIREEDQSPVDGRRVAYAGRRPHMLVQTGWRGRDPSLTLEIACFGRSLSVLFQSRHLIASHNMRSTVRIGERIERQRMRRAESLKAAGFWGEAARAVLVRIMEADEVAVRIEEPTWGTTEAVFDVRGAREATARVREQCGGRWQ